MCHADLGEQPHGFRLVAVFEQVGPDDLLGRGEVAVGEQRRRGDHLGREVLERGDVSGGGGGVLRIAAQAVETYQHAPAGGQSRVNVYRAQQRLDGARRIPQRQVAEAALLVHLAEVWLALLETLKHRQRFGDALQMTQAHCPDQDQIAVIRMSADQRLRRAQGLVVASVRLQGAQATDIGLNRGRRCDGGCGVHEPPDYDA